MDTKAVERLIDEEWSMFQQTNNIGGKAPCQDDFATFFIMRAAQMMALTDEIIQACFNDMMNAKKNGRNLVAEKYAYMMQFTAFEEYLRIAFMLPEISDEKAYLVRSITDKVIRWAEEAKQKYPAIAGSGRVLHAYDDSFNSTSIETYCYGEMATYSMETLVLINYYYEELLANGKNLWIMIQNNLTKMLGYSSIDQAEQSLLDERELH